MKKILLLLVISLLGIGLFGQSKFKKGIQVGRNGATMDSITVDGDYIYFHSGEDKWSNDTLNGIAGISNKVDINTAYRDTFMNLKSGYINVKDFGAVGDGVTDDRDAIYNALIAARDGNIKTVIFPYPKVSYKINSVIDIDNIDGDITILGNNSMIDGSGISSTYVAIISLKGRRSTMIKIDQDIVKGQNYLKCSGIDDVVKGDVIDIWNNELRYAIGAEEYKGELRTVKSVDGDSIVFLKNIYDSYDADSTKIMKLYCDKITVNGLKIKGNINLEQTGLWVAYARYINISDNYVTGCRRTSIVTHNVASGVINKNYGRDASLTGTGYVINVASSEDVIIQNNECLDGRHAIALGGSNDGKCRGVKILDNICQNSLDFGINIHPGCEFIDFERNTIYGRGFTASGHNITIRDNTVHLMKSNDIGIDIPPGQYADQYQSRYIIIDNNTVLSKDEYVSSAGINITPTTDTAYVESIIITNNKLMHTNTPIIIGSTTKNMNYDKLIIKNNYCTSGTNGVLIRNNYGNNLYFTNNNIITEGHGFYQLGGVVDKMMIENNFIETTSQLNRSIQINAINNNITVNNNDLKKGESLSISNLYLNSTNVIFTGNTLTNGGAGGYQIGSATESLYMNDNILINITGTVLNEAQSEPVNFTKRYNVEIPASGNDGDTLAIRIYFNSEIANGASLQSFGKILIYKQRLTYAANNAIYDLSFSGGKTGSSTYGANATVEKIHYTGSDVGDLNAAVMFSNSDYMDIILTSSYNDGSRFSFNLYASFNIKGYSITNY